MLQLETGGSDWRVMGESRLIVEELLALCLQRITMEENSVNTEQGETDSLNPIITTQNQKNVTGSLCRRTLGFKMFS